MITTTDNIETLRASAAEVQHLAVNAKRSKRELKVAKERLKPMVPTGHTNTGTLRVVKFKVSRYFVPGHWCPSYTAVLVKEVL